MDLAKSSTKIFLARVLKSVSGFFAVIIFSRSLGASPLGVYYPFVALLGMLALPGDLGVSHALKKRISEGTEQGAYFGAGLLIKIPALTLVSIGIFVARDFVNQYIGGPVATLAIVALWLRIGAGTLMAVLEGELRVGETAVIRSLRPLGWLVFGYIFITMGFDVLGIIYGYIIGTAAMVVVAGLKLSVYPAIPERRHLRSVFDFGKFSFINSIGGLLYSWIDVLILSGFVAYGIAATRGDIGAYENAWRVSLLVTLASRSISQVIFPQVSQWDANDDRDRIERLLPKANVPGLLFVFPAFVGVAILSRDILAILFGPEFVVAGSALIILVGLRFFQAIDDIYGLMLDALDRPDLTMISTLASGTANVVLNLIFIYYFGILGAAIATTIGVIVKTVFDLHFMRQFLDIKLPVRIMGWSLFASILMGVVIVAIEPIIQPSSLFELSILVAIGGTVYGVVTVVYSPIRSVFKDFSSNMN